MNFNAVKKVKELNKIEFNPMQKAALKKDLLNSNFVVSAPTASGKTLLAEIASLNSVINKRKKVLFMCPLKALTSEHYSSFKKKYSEKLNVKLTISTGDFDSSSHYLNNYDIIFSTYEKVDSLLRHKAEWLKEIGLLVVDEVHEIDSERGPTVEMVITKLRSLNPRLQIMALSATIPNASELSKWLKAELIESNFRPIKLKEGVFLENEIKYLKGKEKIKEEADELTSLAKDTLEKQKQALIFCNTRPRSIAVAKKLSSFTEKTLSLKEKSFLSNKADSILSVLETPTEQCRILSSLVKKGIAFHNAALMYRQRAIVEDLFREGKLKILSATPTLSAGINLPAFRVIIPSIYRYGMFGQQKIPVREYRQMAGRAGRPDFNDAFGESILIAKNEFEADELKEEFILGEIEEVSSKLGIEPVLRTHLLAAIASGFVFDLESLEQFFSKTFYAFQFKDTKELFLKINEILKELEEMEFISSNERFFKATPLGNRVSELYLDPHSAFSIINALKNESLNELGLLFLISSTYEFFPLLSVPKSKEAELWESLQADSEQLPIDLEKEMFLDPLLLRKFNSALMLKEWINESSEDSIRKNYGVQPGILYSKLLICDWLTYCCSELAKLTGKASLLPFILKMKKRIKPGIKEELILLTELRGIGRVRARKLFNSNIKTINDLKKVSLDSLVRVIGSETAVKVKKQLGEKIQGKILSEKEKHLLQKDLTDF
ncbi:MAG: DEAD/DEAH box helicase [archaeon]